MRGTYGYFPGKYIYPIHTALLIMNNLMSLFSASSPAKAARGIVTLVLIAFGFGLTSPNTASAAKWEPVDAADLSAKDSTSFPGTDVEILRSTHVLNERAESTSLGNMQFGHMLTIQNYVRAKVYTAKGVQDQGKLCIRYLEKSQVANTEARVVKPNGTAILLKKEDMIKNVLAKDKEGMTWNQITFVFPSLEAGDVVEYRWTELIEDEVWLNFFYCQDFVPTREYTLSIESMSRRGAVSWLNCANVTTSDKYGFTVTVRDQPAFEEEEIMPPMREFRGWIYIAKSFPMTSGDEEVVKLLNEEWGDQFHDASRPSATVKKKAEALVVGATTDDEKLRRLYEFCQGEIFNTTYRTSAELRVEIDKHKDDEAYAPAKILEKGRGRRDEINNLFAALARGLGYDAKLAHSASSAEILNIKMISGWAFLYRTSVAVKLGEEWHYYNPGEHFVPYGMLDWQDEKSPVLRCGAKKPDFGTTSSSTADKTQGQRKARLTLDAEGTLEGEIEETFTGHLAITRKNDHWGESIDIVNKSIQDKTTARLPNAEVSDIVWTNLTVSDMPLSVKYHVKVPGYAQQAGKRLVFAPAFFQAGAPALLAAAERKFPVFFSYPWLEHDDIEIVLPEGYTLDKPSAPTSIGALNSALGVEYHLQYSGKKRIFSYRRDFALGANGAYAFRRESYPELKTLFGKLHDSDSHSIVLKPKAAPPPASVSTGTVNTTPSTSDVPSPENAPQK
jgi:hypothetical protein